MKFSEHGSVNLLLGFFYSHIFGVTLEALKIIHCPWIFSKSLPLSLFHPVSLSSDHLHHHARSLTVTMKPPKRSPFLHSRQTDLLEVYRHLYPDSPFLPSNTSSAMGRHKALSVVQLWINRSACPFAVETTALLVQSVILDEHMQQIAASTASGAVPSLHYALEQMGGFAELGVRTNYSLALTRFVNSVVDSHQTGGFAQSIAAIAARIGLPLWFVEIRHAVTHEELPSIAVCRQAARSALAWLHRHFWIPQLFEGPNALNFVAVPGGQSTSAMDIDAPEHHTSQGSTSARVGSSGQIDASQQRQDEEEEATRKADRRKALQDLRTTLKNYRQLAKQVTRDRSLANTSKDQFRRLYKQFAVFVSKIRTLEPDFATHFIDNAGSSKRGKDEEIDVRGATVMDPDEVDECTKSALSDLINQLIQPGGLIPLSKTKRVAASASGDDIALPTELASLWTPLLGYLRDTFGPIFGQLLTEELVDAVVQNNGHSKQGFHDEQASQEGITGSNQKDDNDQDEDDDDDPSSQSWKATAYSSPSYRKTAEAWIRYLVSTIPPSSAGQMPHIASTNRSATALITDAEVAEMCLPMRAAASTDLLDFLGAKNAALGKRIRALVAVMKVASFVTQSSTGMDEDEQLPEFENKGESGFTEDLEVMQKRLDEYRALQLQQSNAMKPNPDAMEDAVADRTMGGTGTDGVTQVTSNDVAATTAAVVAEKQRAGKDAGNTLPIGWSLASNEWKPTPFGCLNGKIPNLVLDL